MVGLLLALRLVTSFIICVRDHTPTKLVCLCGTFSSIYWRESIPFGDVKLWWPSLTSNWEQKLLVVVVVGIAWLGLPFKHSWDSFVPSQKVICVARPAPRQTNPWFKVFPPGWTFRCADGTFFFGINLQNGATTCRPCWSRRWTFHATRRPPTQATTTKCFWCCGSKTPRTGGLSTPTTTEAAAVPNTGRTKTFLRGEAPLKLSVTEEQGWRWKTSGLQTPGLSDAGSISSLPRHLWRRLN